MRTTILVAALALLGSCTGQSAESEMLECIPTATDPNPLIGIPEVRAEGPDEVEGWALVFSTKVAPGEPLRMSADEEAKIAWRLTGEGDVSFRAVAPDGEVHQLTWGPDGPRGSNWDRPGQEWGTGWIFPTPGCWTLEATRGTSVLSIAADIT